MNLNSPGSNVMGYVYVGPYYAMINGVETAVICDDFGDESYVPETWTADVFNAPNYVISPTDETRNAYKYSVLPQPQPYTLAQDYNMVGWLATEMLAYSGNQTTVGDIHYALWAVFDPTALPYLQSVDPTDAVAASTWLSNAAAYANNSSFISSFTIYSPDTNYPISYPGSTTNPPQEFLVHTPEPAALAVLGLDLSGLAGLVFVLRRRMRQSHS